jgi:hypothetical protein
MNISNTSMAVVPMDGRFLSGLEIGMTDCRTLTLVLVKVTLRMAGHWLSAWHCNTLSYGWF